MNIFTYFLTDKAKNVEKECRAFQGRRADDNPQIINNEIAGVKRGVTKSPINEISPKYITESGKTPI